MIRYIGALYDRWDCIWNTAQSSLSNNHEISCCCCWNEHLDIDNLIWLHSHLLFKWSLMRMQRVLIKYPNKLSVNSFIVRNGFQFATININGLIDWEEKNNAVRFFSWLLKKKCDIISVRETHGAVSDIKKWEKIESFSLWNNGEWPSRGVAILFNIHQGVVIKEDTKDNNGRVLSCEIKIENRIYKLINIYCSNNNAEQNNLFYLSIDT